jgi:hypothetical protein
LGPGEPTAQQAAADTTAAAAEAANSVGPDFPGYDPQLVLHDLTSAVPFAPRSFISNEDTTFAPSSSQQHRRLSVAIPSQVKHCMHSACLHSTAPHTVSPAKSHAKARLCGWAC